MTDKINSYPLSLNVGGVYFNNENGKFYTYINKHWVEIDAKGDEEDTGNYNDLINKPRIESVELIGNKTLDEIGVRTMTENEIDLLF